MNYLDELLAMESIPGPGPERTEALRKMKARHDKIEKELGVQKKFNEDGSIAIDRSKKVKESIDIDEDELVFETMEAASLFIATEGVNDDSCALVRVYSREMQASLEKIKRYQKGKKYQQALTECDKAINTYNSFKSEIDALTSNQNMTEVILGNLLHIAHMMLYKMLLALPVFGHIAFAVEGAKDIKHILTTIKKIAKGGVKLDDFNMCTSTLKMGLDAYATQLNHIRRHLVVLIERDK